MRSAGMVAVTVVIAAACVSAAPLPRPRQNETTASRFHRLTDKDKNSPKRKETAVLGGAMLEDNAGPQATRGALNGTLDNATEGTAGAARNRATLDTPRDAMNASSKTGSEAAESGPPLGAVNQTAYDRMNETSSEAASGENMTNVTPFIFVMPVETSKTFDAYMGVRDHCILPTCLTANLGSSLQGGDEKAGDSTSDPFGIGKK